MDQQPNVASFSGWSYWVRIALMIRLSFQPIIEMKNCLETAGLGSAMECYADPPGICLCGRFVNWSRIPFFGRGDDNSDSWLIYVDCIISAYGRTTLEAESCMYIFMCLLLTKTILRFQRRLSIGWWCVSHIGQPGIAVVAPKIDSWSIYTPVTNKVPLGNLRQKSSSTWLNQ